MEWVLGWVCAGARYIVWSGFWVGYVLVLGTSCGVGFGLGMCWCVSCHSCFLPVIGTPK